MKVIWSDFASEMLNEIYSYHKEITSVRIAKKIKKGIFVSTKHLLRHPQLGQIQIYLEQLNEGHRHIVERNYKIIYKEIDKRILITDVFHTRQNPIKLERNK